MYIIMYIPKIGLPPNHDFQKKNIQQLGYAPFMETPRKIAHHQATQSSISTLERVAPKLHLEILLGS